MEQYIVVTGSSAASLQSAVSASLVYGYHLVGGLAVNGGNYAQALWIERTDFNAGNPDLVANNYKFSSSFL